MIFPDVFMSDIVWFGHGSMVSHCWDGCHASAKGEERMEFTKGNGANVCQSLGKSVQEVCWLVPVFILPTFLGGMLMDFIHIYGWNPCESNGMTLRGYEQLTSRPTLAVGMVKVLSCRILVCHGVYIFRVFFFHPLWHTSWEILKTELLTCWSKKGLIIPTRWMIGGSFVIRGWTPGQIIHLRCLNVWECMS